MNQDLNGSSPEFPDTRRNLIHRHRTSKVWNRILFGSTVFAIVALIALLFNNINQSFGYVVQVNKLEVDSFSAVPLEAMTQPALIDVLKAHLSKGEIARLAAEQPFEQRPASDLRDLVTEKVIQPSVEKTYTLTESLFHLSAIRTEAAADYPEGKLVFRSWITRQFIERPMSSKVEFAGVRTALFGSLWMIAITILLAFPIGVGAAVYLEEYAIDGRVQKIIQTNIDNLAGVPSIIYGILGLSIFVRMLAPFTSGAAFGVTGMNGRTLLSAGLTMALLVLPVIIINTQEALRSVPATLKQASYGLGATQWQTIWFHVLPYAMPGILTGTILAISRAIGETAPLIVVGAATFITKDPTGPFSTFTVLPIQIYNWITRPQAEFRNIAAAAILILLVTLLSLNAAAILLRNKLSRRNA
jgi:phosphate transport system permease protein